MEGHSSTRGILRILHVVMQYRAFLPKFLSTEDNPGLEIFQTLHLINTGLQLGLLVEFRKCDNKNYYFGILQNVYFIKDLAFVQFAWLNLCEYYVYIDRN